MVYSPEGLDSNFACKIMWQLSLNFIYNKIFSSKKLNWT